MAKIEGGTFRLSQYLQTLRLDEDTYVVANGLTQQRMAIAESIYTALMLFADEPLTLAEFIDAIDLEDVATSRETLTAMFRAFHEKGFVVPTDQDEQHRVRELIRARLKTHEPFARWQMPHRISIDSLVVPPVFASSLRHVEILLLGGCVAQLVDEPLRAIAASYGLTVGVRSGWISDASLLEEPTDLVVVQPGTYRLLAPLWGGPALFESEASRRRALDDMKREIATLLQPFEQFRGYVLLQGTSAPQVAPYGHADARLATGHHRIVFELNEQLRAFAAERPNVIFVDEERLAGNHGKSLLFDDMITTMAHHGTRTADLPHLLAREYLDCYVILSGLRRIKCIVTDLDNTLWQGVVGEGEPPTIRPVPYLAIHEALLWMKERGIVLATCSKNNFDDVMRFWRRFDGRPGHLRPEDFVLHQINWDPKSQNVQAIIDKTGIAADAMLFLDDNPVERAEVSARFPTIRLLGDKLDDVRRALLVDPHLQPNVLSGEARARTDTTRAAIAREAAREQVSDPAAFLRSIEIRINVARVTSKLHVERLVELSQRTNQFNTTLVRYDAPALERLISDPGASVWAMAAMDRFATYGIVGIGVVIGDRIENICISCRTIGIAVDQPFLATILEQSKLYRQRVTGHIVLGDRNQPARRIFLEAAFSDAGDHVFVREPTEHPPAIDASTYRVAVRPDAELDRFD